MLKKTVIYMLGILGIIANVCYSADLKQGIIISNDIVALYESADIKSKKLGSLQPGETVDIIEVTKKRLKTGRRR